MEEIEELINRLKYGILLIKKSVNENLNELDEKDKIGFTGNFIEINFLLVINDPIYGIN